MTYTSDQLPLGLDAGVTLGASDALVGQQSGSTKAVFYLISQVVTAVLALLGDTDGTATANSDAKIATQKAMRTYVAGAITASLASSDVMVYKGVIDCSANPNYPAADAGAVYVISVAGKIGGASGVSVEAGDLAICKTDGTASGNQATVGAAWDVIQTNIVNALTTAGGTLAGALNEAPAVSIASSTTPAIGAAASNAVTITGTTSITGFDTIAAGALRELTFAGILTLTHNATSLILPGAANITTAAGDVAYFRSLGSGNWRCVGYQRANGQPLNAAVLPVTFQLALSDLVTSLATGTGVGYFDAPFAFTLTEVIATALTASSSGLPQFAVKKNGTTMLSTNVTIDASETSSATAATPAVISVTSVAKGDRITFDIVAAGTGTKGAQITLVGTKP